MVIALAPARARKPAVRRNAVRSQPQPPATKKGRERRNRIKKVMTKLLETQSYHAIRISDIAKKADIPASVFYHYFKSKEELTVELLEEMHQEFERRVLAGAPYAKLYDGIQSVTHAIFDLYAENFGLVRALVELDEQGLSQKWEDLTLNWQKLVAKSVEDDIEPGQVDHKMSLATAYALSGMCNSFAHAYFMTGTPALKAAFPDQHAAADFAAQLWFRALRLANPSDEGDVVPFLMHLPAARLRKA